MSNACDGSRNSAVNGSSRREYSRSRLWVVRAGLALILLLWTSALPGAAKPGSQVRNDNPTPPANLKHHVDPIYYPLNPRRDPAAGGAEEVIAEDLLRQFMEYHTSMRYEDAAEVALRLVEIAPDRPMVHYNLACVMGRLTRVEESLAALEKAVDCGWRNVRHTVIEPDLAVVRRDEEFGRLIRRMGRLAADERITATPLRDDPVESIAAEIEREATACLDRYHVPGAAMALVRGGEVAWEGSFGLKDEPAGEPMNADDLFQLSAPVNMLALVAALQQEASGELSLPHLLVEVAEIADNGPRSGPRPVIVRPTAGGSGSVAYLLPYRDRGDDSRPAGDGKHAGRSDSQSTCSLLCLAVEVAAEERFPRYCRQHILTPLRMNSTSFDALDEDDAQRLAVGHSRLGTPTAPLPRRAGGSSSVFINAGDLGRLIAGLMSGSDPQVPRLGREQLQRVGAIQEALPGGLGLGIQIRRTPGGLCVELTGNANGVGCFVRFYPDENVGAAVLFNSETGLEAARRLAHIGLGGI